jgi:hypothetical protein
MPLITVYCLLITEKSPHPKKKELGEKFLILRQGFCKVTGQHLGILLKCPYHEVDFTTDRV